MGRKGWASLRQRRLVGRGISGAGSSKEPDSNLLPNLISRLGSATLVAGADAF